MMNSPRFLFAAATGALSVCLLTAGQSIGQTTATTDPVGYAQTACLASTDTKLALPFSRPAEFVGAIASVSGSTITTVNALPTGTSFVYGSNTSSTPGETSKTYYAIIGPNITVLANTVSVTNASPTVTGTGLSSIVAGDEFLVSGLAFGVLSVSSDGTSLTLDRNYTGVTASGLSASFDHSLQEGRFYQITANDTNTLTVNLNNDTLGAVTAGTTVSVIPYWTLGSTFPPGDLGVSYANSTGSALNLRGTQILLPDLVTQSTNLSTNGTYYYYNGAWRKAGGALATSYNDTVLLPPSTYFTMRNAATQTTFTPSGGVYMNRVAIQLDTNTSSAVDTAVAVARPTDVALNDLGLIASGAFTPSTGSSLLARKDQLLVYDNTATGVNKSSANTYYYLSGKWQKAGGTLGVDSGSITIPYGSGFTIRKAISSNGGVTSFWQNNRNY